MPSAVAKVADAKNPAEIIPAAPWSVAQAGYLQDHKSECLSLQIARPRSAPRLFARCRQLMDSAKAAWRAASPEFQSHQRLSAQLREARQQLDVAEDEHDEATAAVRDALVEGKDPSAAETREADAGR